MSLLLEISITLQEIFTRIILESPSRIWPLENSRLYLHLQWWYKMVQEDWRLLLESSRPKAPKWRVSRGIPNFSQVRWFHVLPYVPKNLHAKCRGQRTSFGPPKASVLCLCKGRVHYCHSPNVILTSLWGRCYSAWLGSAMGIYLR